MIFDKKGNITIITQESVSIPTFLSRLNEAYDKINKDNIIINLFSLDNLRVSDLLEFLQVSDKHRGRKRSFVIVTDTIKFDDIPEELVVVPSFTGSLRCR